MAEEDNDTTPDQRSRRQRPTPTIDLTATEVPPETAPPENGAQTDSAASESSGKSDAPQPEEAAQMRSEPPPAQAAAASSPRRVGGYLVAGAAGAVFAAIVAIVLAVSGYIPARTGDDGTLRSQLAGVQSRVQELANRNTGQADRQALDRLTQRIDRIEQTASKSPSDAAASDAAVLNRLTSADTTVKALGAALTALSQRVEAATQKADAATKALQDFNNREAVTLDAVTRRIDALERAAKATQDKVANETGADRAARYALACLALRDAVARGAPYAAELSAVKALGSDGQAVAALEPFAASGVPSDARMAADLKTLLPKMAAAAGSEPPRSDGFIARIRASAERLVRIRPVGEPTGDEPSAVLARIAGRLSHDDGEGAAAEVARLPDKARAVAAPWLKTFDERRAAIAASHQLAADSAGALATR